MDTIDGMRTFVAVALQQSFTGGAKTLGISTKLASKYIGQLEDKLATQLFNRTTRSVTLTEAGNTYLRHCVPILNQINELESILQENQTNIAGPIRLSAPTGFGSQSVIDALSMFQQTHPRIAIDLHLSDHRVSIIEEGIDLAIRLGELEDSSLIARKLTQMDVVVFASKDYLQKHGTPTHPRELAEHNCLALTIATTPNHWAFEANLQNDSHKFIVPIKGDFKSNSPKALVNMAIKGQGISRAPIYAVAPYIKSGQLEVLFSDYQTEGITLNAIFPPNRHLTTRIRTLIDYFVIYFSQLDYH